MLTATLLALGITGGVFLLLAWMSSYFFANEAAKKNNFGASVYLTVSLALGLCLCAELTVEHLLGHKIFIASGNAASCCCVLSLLVKSFHRTQSLYYTRKQTA